MIFATAIVGLAFWQAQVAAAKEAEARHKTLPPPGKTKHAVRPPAAVFSGDVVADYVARCEKGLTDQEIGWILEDFRNAGLDLDWRNPKITVEDLFSLRAAQHRWYHDALVEGLRLSPEQSTQVMTNLDELFEKTKQGFLAEKAYRAGPSNVWTDIGKPFYQDARDLFSDLHGLMMPPSGAITPSTYMPWTVCQLTPEQEKLTWKQWFLSIKEKNLVISNKEVAELSGGPLFRSQEPVSEGYPVDKLLLHQSSLPDLIFPLLAQQKLIAKELPGDPFSEPSDPPALSALENVRLMHPCQFKALLLFNPGFSPMLQSQLASGSK